MRPSPKFRLNGLAIAFSLGPILALSMSAGADALRLGEALPTVTVPSLPTVSVPALPPVTVPPLPSATVQAGPLTVETSPTPSVEVSGVVTVQTPSTPQLPAVPPVTTPTTPTLSTPSTPLPLPQTPGGSTSRSSTGSGQASATATTAAAGASSGSTPAGAGGKPTASGRRARRRAQAAGAKRARAAAAAAATAAAKSAATSAKAQAASGAVPARSAASASAHKNAAGGGPLNALGRHIPFPVPVPDWSKPIILLLLAVALWFAARWRVAGLRARRLERQRASLVRDLGSMQATLVPVIPGRVGELSVSVAYRPADGPAAGGDFYDVFALQPGKVAIVLGDVAGHGRDALAQAALTRYTLRAYLQAGLEPRAALALAGSVLDEPAKMRFATVVVAVHDSSSGRLTYATAGHPPPISVGFDTPEPLTVCCSAPICCDLPTGRRQTTISAPASGQVCFFSDGLPEARTDAGLLGRERLVELLDGLARPVTAPVLLERVRAEALATPDDMVACVISPRVGDSAPASTIEELEVDARTPDGGYVAAFLGACGVRDERVAPLLASVADAVDHSGAALLRVERAPGGQTDATVLAGLSSPAGAAAIEQARRSGVSALAPALAR
jgi:hypothetical protein